MKRYEAYFRPATTRYLLLLAAIAALSVSAYPQKSKNLELTAKASEGQVVEILGFSGADIDFKSWDKPEVFVTLTVEYSSSDDDWEKEYLKEVRLSEQNSTGSVTIRFDQPNRTTGFSFRRLLSLDFNSYTKRRITGEIYVPRKNSLFSDFRYGKMTLEGIEGTLDLEGKSNTVTLKECKNVRSVENDYGTTTIEHSSGELRAMNKSGKLTVSNFSGPVNIDAQYATITLSTLSKGADVISQSGTLAASDIAGDLTIKAPYSRVTVERVKGMVTVEDKSGSLIIEDVGGVSIDAPYTSAEVTKVSGTASQTITFRGQSSRLELFDAKGNVVIESPYTNIRLRNIDGNVDLGTVSGGVTADGVSGSWTSDTKYTRLDLRSLRSLSVTIDNTSGAVELELSVKPEKVSIINSYGDINVSMPKGLDASVRLKAEYGSIRSDLAVEVEKLSSSSSAIAIGSVGSGKGTFRLETKSGNIRVDEK